MVQEVADALGNSPGLFGGSWPWFTIGCGSAGAALLVDQLMFRGVPGPLDTRLTIPTTNKYIYYNGGLRMHLVHSLAMMTIPRNHPSINGVGLLFTAGILLYSGSCYGFCWRGTEILRKLQRVGNFCFLAGWCTLLFTRFKYDVSQI